MIEWDDAAAAAGKRRVLGWDVQGVATLRLLPSIPTDSRRLPALHAVRHGRTERKNRGSRIKSSSRRATMRLRTPRSPIRHGSHAGRLEPSWRKLRLTVQILTKLNRSHVIHGQVAYVLPCLGRLEIDRQASGEQVVTIEDATGCVHGSRGCAEPASPHLRSEPSIVAGMAKARLAPNSRVDWDAWVADYDRIRDAIARTLPEIFHDFNARMWTPGGFHRPLKARERIWDTPSGKASFVVPAGLDEDPDMPEKSGDALRLITLRSNDQFTSSVYSADHPYRGDTRKPQRTADECSRHGAARH
jgi:hypothetical protein